jgi:two-component system response regulator NreC
VRPLDRRAENKPHAATPRIYLKWNRFWFPRRQCLSPEVSRAVVQAYQNKTEVSAEPLSPRERQVLQLIAEGKATKEVAVVLNISVKTAETHRTRLMEKLDIHETAGLVRYAVRRGLVQA